MDIFEEEQVSEANRAEGALTLSQALPARLRKLTKEQGNALLYEEQAHLNKLGDGRGLKISGCPTQPKTNLGVHLCIAGW